MVTPILKIINNIIMEILIQWSVDLLGLSIGLRMENGTQF
jgi:hypothetical protein